ncbi:MAG: UbiA family prenyltransferase [Euryarchaeota archaeon]|nr:UbiA family prenyltransferase [Euryarchaeota archaeon]
MNGTWKEMAKAYIDLTRLQFGFAWPLLFCSGLFLAFMHYGGFDWVLLLKVVLIGFLGFEAGFVLNDYVDRNLDKKDVESSLTNYWRLFKKRPISAGLISPEKALGLFFVLVAITVVLILTLPYPHSFYLLGVMVYCYSVEYFYQVYKRTERFPLAQLLGRTDFAMFPVAGYLIVGHPDMIALLYFLFFYPFAMAHLGANDLIDIENDTSRGMKTVTVLYGIQGTSWWILFFTCVHIITAIVFAVYLGWYVLIGFAIGFILLMLANRTILKQKTPLAALKVLPCFHVTMIIYSLSLIIIAVLHSFYGIL